VKGGPAQSPKKSYQPKRKSVLPEEKQNYPNWKPDKQKDTPNRSATKSDQRKRKTILPEEKRDHSKRKPDKLKENPELRANKSDQRKNPKKLDQPREKEVLLQTSSPKQEKPSPSSHQNSPNHHKLEMENGMGMEQGIEDQSEFNTDSNRRVASSSPTRIQEALLLSVSLALALVFDGL
jgi:hypothetical protein